VPPLIVVIDVGKTNSKLSLVEPGSGETLWRVTRANGTVVAAGLRQLDVVAIERWLLDMLRSLPHKDRVTAIVPIAHGAAAVLVDEQGANMVAPDYEDPAFDEADDAYESERDDFQESYSPRLPLGLNLGRQLYFLERQRPLLFAKTRHILLYPQYWAWRLSGAMASEVTSLGCHSDLWLPLRRTYSQLAQNRHWAQLFPPLRFAADVLGNIRAEIAQATGLNPVCRVSCGIHDSNASYLQQRLARGDERPLCVISSGTWTVIMANETELGRLHAEHDMLANVDIFASPLGTARFMGGREYALIAPSSAQPDRSALSGVLRHGSMALPSFAPGGLFARTTGRLLRANELTDLECAALATLYVSLMSDLTLDSLGVDGDIVIDGPFAANPLFCQLLATWRPANRVFVIERSDTNVAAACYLGGIPCGITRNPTAAQPLQLQGLEDYRVLWRRLLPT